MKIHMKRIVVFMIILSLLTTTAYAAGAGETVYINERQVAENLTYTNTISWNSLYGREESFMLGLEQGGDAYPIVMACDTIYGSMSISRMVTYAESQGKNVLAAVNTDFFSTTTGVPDGIVIEDGIYKSSPEGSTAVAFTSEGDVIVSENPQVSMAFTNNGSSTNSANIGKTVAVSHFNKYRTDTGGLYLFSSAFSSVSTRTSTAGWFVKFKILQGQMSVSGSMTLEVVETTESASAASIGDGYLVLTASSAGGWGAQYSKFSVGDLVTLTTTCSDERLCQAQWATGGGDVLVSNGTVTESSKWDQDIAGQNPRTAIGVKEDGSIVCYVIDGRNKTYSNGIKLTELAEELMRQGCAYAVNFDGGGSSAMSVQLPGSSACAVVNEPSDGALRKCATYILFVTDAVSDGKPNTLSLNNDGVLVLAGSETALHYAAVDSGYNPVAVPGDIRAVTSGLGTIRDATYTAGNHAGLDTLTLTSGSTGASGSASIHVVSNLTGVNITKKGSTLPLTTLSVSPGETIQLCAEALFYGRDVDADEDAFTYAVAGEIGTISDLGLFTAGPLAGVLGKITVCVGDVSATINVTVKGFSDTRTHWAKDYIETLADAGIVTGITATTYEPESNIKRGDFVLMLYRAAGKPSVQTSSTFSDVTADDYYAAAIAWAEQNGIAHGNGNGQFAPQAAMTREQAFTFVYRALRILSCPYTDGSIIDLSGFSDTELLSDYAVIPAATLVKMEIVSGDGGQLNPSANLTRAQMAKILCMAIGL